MAAAAATGAAASGAGDAEVETEAGVCEMCTAVAAAAAAGERADLVARGAHVRLATALAVWAGRSSSVATAGCNAVVNLAADEAYSAALQAAGLGEAVIRALHIYVEDAALVRVGCTALRNLAAVADTSVALQAGGAPWAVLEAMRRHRDNLSVAVVACEALCNISAAEGNVVPMYSAGAAAETVEAVSRHGRDAAVARAACVLFRNMTAARELQGPLSGDRVAAALLAVLRQHGRSSVDVVRPAMAALANLVPAQAVRLCRDGAVVVVLDTAAANREDLDVSRHVCRLLHCFGPLGVDDMLELSADRVIIDLLMVHGATDATLATMAANTLCLLVARSPATPVRVMCREHAAAAAVAMIEAHAASLPALAAGCGVLSALAAAGAQDQERMWRAGAARTLAMVLNRRQEEQLVTAAVGALTCMFGDDHTHPSFMTTEALGVVVPAVAAALLRPRQSAAVVAAELTLMHRLALTPMGLMPAATGVDAAHAVARALAATLVPLDAAQCGLAALHHLTTRAGVAATLADHCDGIVGTMMRHPMDMEVVTNAIFSLEAVATAVSAREIPALVRAGVGRAIVHAIPLERLYHPRATIAWQLASVASECQALHSDGVLDMLENLIRRSSAAQAATAAIFCMLSALPTDSLKETLCVYLRNNLRSAMHAHPMDAILQVAAFRALCILASARRRTAAPTAAPPARGAAMVDVD